MSELRECPFCGGVPVLNHIEPHTHHMQIEGLPIMPDHHGCWTIECCDVGMIKDTREEVVSAWNRRASPVQAEPDAWLLCCDSDPIPTTRKPSKIDEQLYGPIKPLYAHPPSGKDAEDENKAHAIYELVSAIYFSDSSDYLTHIYTALSHLSPELWREVDDNPKAAFDKAVSMRDAAMSAEGSLG